MINPEDEDNWEEDTTDTEIMKNINSLLDSGKPSFAPNFLPLDLYESKYEAHISIPYAGH
jgi:hypothetical protein